jgi:hypothetical protein
MWEFPGRATGPRFLIIGRSQRARLVSAESLPAELLERVILYGALTTLDGSGPVGVALALHAPDRGAVAALLQQDQRLGLFSEIEIHDWEFGGRR